MDGNDELAGIGRGQAAGRIGKDEYYLNIAQEVAQRSTCLRRGYGAVIVKEEQIIASGYNGAPRGTVNCCDNGVCIRNSFAARKGQQYEDCPAVHAEQNAIIHAGRLDMIGSDLYLVGYDCQTGEALEDTQACTLCRRMIINAGIKRVFVRAGGKVQQETVDDWKWEYRQARASEETGRE